MKIKNLYYGIVGIIAYNKQFREQKVDIKPTSDNYWSKVKIDDSRELSIHYIPDINKLGIAFIGFLKFHKDMVIVVDDNYMAVPETLQEAMVAHEIGHYINNHLNLGFKQQWENCVFLGKLACASDEEKNLLIEHTLNTRNYNDELVADEYAVARCGLEATLAVLRTFGTLLPQSIAEINARYRALTGMDIYTEIVTLKDRLKTIWSDATVISIESLDE